MSQIKSDLICEIIRLSQINLLCRKQKVDGDECDEQAMVDWVKKNAANYREKFRTRLQAFSTSELGGILKKMTGTGRDLNDILDIEPTATQGHRTATRNSSSQESDHGRQ